jgi:hypothetical protein
VQPITDAWQRDLLPGERVLWTGQPAKRIGLTSRDVFQFGFSIVWIGLLLSFGALSPLIDIVRSGDLSRLPVALVFLLFLGAGIYFTVGRWLLQSNLRRRTCYAVTDQRVLVRTNLRGTRIDAISLDALPLIATHDRGDGSGGITFGDTFQFTDIPKVQEVYQLIISERDRRRRLT